MDKILSISKRDYEEEKKKKDFTLDQTRSDNTINLKEFIIKDKEYRITAILAIVCIIFQMLIFKYWYPYSSFINGDSYEYLSSAFNNNTISIYPIGYSKFLRLFSVFSHSDTALFVFQYTFLQFSTLAFVFTLFYYYKLSKPIKIIILGFMLFNPVSLYLANYVSSDSLFLSLSLIWFTILIWLIYKPTLKLVLFHTIILFLVFTVRYNALYYPFLSILSFIIQKSTFHKKAAGIFLSIIPIWVFINFNENKYYYITMQKQFTPFSGWQLANNSMFAYKFVNNDELKPVPEKFSKLDKMVREYFNSSRNNISHPEENIPISTIYIWTSYLPLRAYMKLITKDSINLYGIKNWSITAPLYKEYGLFIIKTYPNKFINHFIYPNIINYFSPPIEYLQYYSTGIDSVNYIAQFWFNYKTNKIYTNFKDFKVNILNFYPILIAIINILILSLILSFLFLRQKTNNRLLSKIVILILCFWVLNFCFSVFASPIALRFQLFPTLIILSFSLILLDYILMDMVVIKNLE